MKDASQADFTHQNEHEHCGASLFFLFVVIEKQFITVMRLAQLLLFYIKKYTLTSVKVDNSQSTTDPNLQHRSKRKVHCT